MRKKQSPEQALVGLVVELRKSSERWNNINVNGCNDPGWSDGVNMNLISNHVFSYKRQIRELCEANNLPIPVEYHSIVTPEHVPNDYMAHPDEIRKKAIASLAAFRLDPAMSGLGSISHNLLGEKANAASYILRIVSGLQKAIDGDDLVAMRRYGDVSYDLNRARELVESVSEKDLNPQLSLFSFMDGGAPRPEPRHTPPSKRHKQYER